MGLKLSSRRSLCRPHAFIEFKEDIEAQYVKYQHVFCSNKYLAISGFRVFGLGSGNKPAIPENFSVKREEDRRNAFLTHIAAQMLKNDLKVLKKG